MRSGRGVGAASARLLLTAAALVLLGAGLLAIWSVESLSGPTSMRATARPHVSSPGGIPPRPIVLPPQGSLASAPLISVQALGDSVPTGAECDCASYVVRLAEQLARTQGQPVGTLNQAVDGQTSGGLLTQVTHKNLHASPNQLTVITVGANDFDSGPLSGPGCSLAEGLACYSSTLQALRANLDAVLSALVAGGGPHGPVAVTGYWNIFLDGDSASALGTDYVRDSDGLTRAVNAVLSAETKRHGMVYVDLYAPFKAQPGGNDTGLLAADGDHPSAAGHTLIASRVAAEVSAAAVR